MSHSGDSVVDGSSLRYGAIAVVGLSCRLPGADNVKEFWGLLRDGVDAVGAVPASRRDPGVVVDGAAGCGLSIGGYLRRVDGFDAELFGVSPREARAMDPQQRLMLELGWEALEDARLAPDSIRNSGVGVFVGVMADDYAVLSRRAGVTGIGHHTLTGINRSILANRLSHFLGLVGPSMTVDTGQSSSLVAIHLACESIRHGESSMALAGGVQLNLVVDSTVAVTEFGALSPDGRCFTFDARANGYVRGEGGGVVVLKPLSRALADGDHVYCVIAGSAVNNDGSGEGLTTPSSPAQESVLRLACRRAQVEPATVQYVELHGTGTRVGDPIEATALGAAYGSARSGSSPLWVGSVKTNVGHLEGAAGVVGLIKTALALEHRLVPPSLNFEHPNPAIRFEEWNLRVVRSVMPWPQRDTGLLAGVSSFGMGGTNCHVLLGSAPQGVGRRPAPAGDRPHKPDIVACVPWVLSGHTDAALRAQALRLARHVDARSEVSIGDVGLSLATTRATLPYRGVVLGHRREQLVEALHALSEGRSAAGVVRGKADLVRPAGTGGVVFVFPGQGSQWSGMAVELLETSTAFAESMAGCEAALVPFTDWSLIGVLRGEPGGPPWERPDVIQPVLWAVMVSLAALWRSCGLQPAAVVGHSQGELVAACVAGALSLEDGARVVASRGKLITEALSGGGGMVSVGLPLDVVRERLSRWENRLSIGPSMVRPRWSCPGLTMPWLR